LFHGGDRDAALRDACDNWLKVDGEPWNKVRQREYMEKKAQQSVDFDDEREDSDCPLKKLKSLSANGKSAKMRAQMLDDTYILKDLAILGQWTVFYAAPNAGKTLLTLWLLREAIGSGQVNGADVYYCNYDDHYKGGVEKLEIAEQAGFQMVLPNVSGSRPDQIVELMQGLTETNKARGQVIILDTLKKFTDLMDKGKASEFGDVARLFITAGGSIIGLAHVNKHKDDSGKSVYEGTSDIYNDTDCTFIIEKISDDTQETHVVQFDHGKQRGDTALKQSFQYTKAKGGDYMDIFNSVERISDDQTNQQKAASQKARQRKDDDEVIRQIKRVIEQGAYSKSDLVKKVMTEYAISRARILKLLDRYDAPITLGGQWFVDVSDKNRHTYVLFGEVDEDN